MEFKSYEGKRVKIVLQNNFIYQGIILSVGEDFIKINDKYNTIRFISIKVIATLEELNK